MSELCLHDAAFLCDYASARTLHRPLNNPGELCRTGAVRAILRQCGVEERLVSDAASDYDFFVAFGRALPLFRTHPISKQIAFLIEKGLSVAGFAEELPQLWRECSERMLELSLTPQSLLRSLCGAVAHSFSLGELPSDGRLLLSAESVASFRPDGVADWNSWEGMARKTLCASGNAICAVRMTIPEGYRYLRSSRYDADRMLSVGERNTETLAKWFSQQFRFLSQWAGERELPMLLFADGAGEDLLRLLEETERAVGLPPIVWIAEDAPTRDGMIDFSGKQHAHAMRRAIPLLRYPSDGELKDALLQYAARTPLGVLHAVTGGEWQAIPYERHRFLNLRSSLL